MRLPTNPAALKGLLTAEKDNFEFKFDIKKFYLKPYRLFDDDFSVSSRKRTKIIKKFRETIFRKTCTLFSVKLAKAKRNFQSVFFLLERCE